MSKAAKVMVNLDLDDETLSEIEMMRSLRLEHYQRVAANPDAALERLKMAGLSEEASPEQIAANAYAKIIEINERLANPHIIFEDELSLYLTSLPNN